MCESVAVDDVVAENDDVLSLESDGVLWMVSDLEPVWGTVGPL